MIQTTLAAGDLFTAIPSLWEAARIPLAIVTMVSGIGSGMFAIHRGFGAAAGKVIGGIALAAIVLGAVGMAVSTKQTIDRHGGGITVGQYGQ
jgi:hypothetical protein